MRDDVEEGEENHGGKGGGMGRYRGGGEGCKQETCFEILIHGSGRGLEHRDEKKKKKGRGTFEARECSLHLRKSRRCTDGHVGGEQLGQVQCFSLPSESPRLHSTPYWCSVYSECSLFPSPDTNEMSVVQSLNPQCLVKPLKGILTAA